MTAPEWEVSEMLRLCCLNKLEDWGQFRDRLDFDPLHLLDGESCRCKDYDNRRQPSRTAFS